MTTSIRVTCVGLVSNGEVIPVTDQKPVTIEAESGNQAQTDARELIPVTDQGTHHTLAIASLKAAIDTLLDELGEMEQ